MDRRNSTLLAMGSLLRLLEWLGVLFVKDFELGSTHLMHKNGVVRYLSYKIRSDNFNAPPKSLIVGCVYRHPRPTIPCFTDELCDKLMMFCNQNTPFIILGDINIDVSKSSNKQVQYLLNI